ncbi:MAG TPA: MYXO-CTERM sorting domain-containing protein [Hydrogenophaga sp.]|nr:MYXO-CTERM sorting domain-containing protein [Hydrogenophaga sp.]
MNTEMPELLGHEVLHLNGESATDPIEPPGSALAALLLLSGIRLLRRRALPAHALTAHSGLSNCRF